MAPTMSQHYDSDREALRARLLEFRKIAPPSNITLARMMPGYRDKTFRRTMEVAFEGPRSSRTKLICDIASELPWHPTQELSSHDRIVGKVLIGVGIIAGLGLACYAVKRCYQVRQIAGEKRKREEDEEAEIGITEAARDESESRNRQRTSKRGQTPATSSRDVPPAAPAPQAIITEPVSLPKARSPINTEEIAPTPDTSPPWPSAFTYPSLNLETSTPLQDTMALLTADKENDEDEAGLEVTDSVDESDRGNHNDEKDMREGGRDENAAEEAEADTAKGDEEDGSDDDQDDDQDDEHEDHQPQTPVKPTTTNDSPLPLATTTRPSSDRLRVLLPPPPRRGPFEFD